MISTDFLPSLKALSQWVVWRYEIVNDRKTKVPYQITGYKAASDNPRTWTTFEIASRAKGYDGIGVMFANGLCGIDLDHHDEHQNAYIVNGKLTPDAQEWITAIPSYWEVSPSREGLHCLCFGELPEGRRQNDKIGAAFYDTHRFFTVTGLHVDGTALDALPCQNELEVMYRWLFGNEPQSTMTECRPVTDVPLPDPSIDAKIVALLELEGEYRKLWHGDFEKYQGDHSRADIAMAERIMRAVSDHIAWADRVIRKWPCFRQEKWDARHFSNGDTYGQHTLNMVAHHEQFDSEMSKQMLDRLSGYGTVRSRLPNRRNSI